MTSSLLLEFWIVRTHASVSDISLCPVVDVVINTIVEPAGTLHASSGATSSLDQSRPSSREKKPSARPRSTPPTSNVNENTKRTARGATGARLPAWTGHCSTCWGGYRVNTARKTSSPQLSSPPSSSSPSPSSLLFLLQKHAVWMWWNLKCVHLCWLLPCFCRAFRQFSVQFSKLWILLSVITTNHWW